MVLEAMHWQRFFTIPPPLHSSKAYNLATLTLKQTTGHVFEM
jgi:hypothetical protein